MALKLNIKPDVEEEMERLLSKLVVKSKTEYINRAIHEYNKKLNRDLELSRLRGYFKTYQAEGSEIMHEFSKVRPSSD